MMDELFVCPTCGSENVHYSPEPDGEDFPPGYGDYTCNDCGATW